MKIIVKIVFETVWLFTQKWGLEEDASATKQEL